MHGDRENPKVISWGNPGVASTSAFHNATLAAGRRSDGGSYVRRYVPVITAATADYRVEPVRVDTATREAMTFVSMAVETLPERLGSPFRGRAYAVDAGGQIHGWGYNPASIGDERNPFPLAAYVYKSPVPLTSDSDRQADERVVSFRKVVSYTSSRPGNFLALSNSNALYGTEAVSLDNAGAASTASYSVMRLVSTQAWADVVSFGVLEQHVMAVRDDGTLWTTSQLRSTASAQTSQIKGAISAVYLGGPFTQSTNATDSISASVSSPPAGGRKLSFTVERKTKTSSYEVRSVSDSGILYTAEPTVTFSGLENTNNAPAIRLEMLPEYGWSQLSASGDAVLLLNRNNGTSRVFVAYINVPPEDLMPEDDYKLVASQGILEIMHLPGATNHYANPYRDVTAVHAAQGYFKGPVSSNPISAFFVQDNPNTSRSNLLVLGDNAYGQLGIGSTAAIVRTATEVSSPDSADFIVKKIASSRINTFVIRQGEDIPGFAGTHVQHLYTAGMPEFSGGTTATASIRSFTPVLGVNGASSKWEHVFAFGQDEAAFPSRTVVLHVAAYSTVPEDVVQ